MSPAEIDIVLQADPKTVRVVPWAAEPTAQVIHDCFYSDGRRVMMAPRHVLRHVLELYAQRGWEPVVAPELEFYLIEPNIDADYPAQAAGRAVPAAPNPGASPTASPRSTNSIRCSTTSMPSARRRTSRSTR